MLTYQECTAIALIKTVSMPRLLGPHTELLLWLLRRKILDPIPLHFDGRGLGGFDLVSFGIRIVGVRVGFLR